MLERGIQLHGALVKMGFDPDIMISNDLIDMYGKCGKLDMASELFEQMPERNVVSWTMLIGAHLQHGHPKKALNIFCQMCSSEVRPNEFTLSTAVKACSIVFFFIYSLFIMSKVHVHIGASAHQMIYKSIEWNGIRKGLAIIWYI